jgi:hypothetical protein
MNYAIAAYAITFFTLVGYGLHLIRERTRLAGGRGRDSG